MKIPAIRANIGDWIYYVATLSFKEVEEHVKRIDNELHKSTMLSDMLQRSITENYKSITTYIQTHNERFFNALILAVYDGDPQWHEVRLEYESGEEFVDLGILELSSNEKIFPIDGQHRVEGIKRAISESPGLYDDERIPVVFIGHRTDEKGMRRARQLFSTLNRYAKPVSMRDIIALDEDDVIAIISRELIEEHPLFKTGRILDTRNKAIPDNNITALTTIITFYECNRELLTHYLRNKPNGSKRPNISKYIRIRPNDDEINEFKSVCFAFWNALAETIPCINDINNNPDKSIEEYRGSHGGIILFRPVALVPFVKAVVKICEACKLSYEDTFSMIPTEILNISHPAWKWLIWNPDKKQMVMGSKKIIENLIIYYTDKSLLSEKEIKHLVNELKSINQLDDEDDVFKSVLI